MHHNALGLGGWSLTWVKGRVKLFYGRQHQSRKVTESIVMKRKAHAIRRWPLTSCRRSSDPSTAGSCRTSAVAPAPFAWRLLWSSSCHDRWEREPFLQPEFPLTTEQQKETHLQRRHKFICPENVINYCEALTWIQHKAHTGKIPHALSWSECSNNAGLSQLKYN